MTEALSPERESSCASLNSASQNALPAITSVPRVSRPVEILAPDQECALLVRNAAAVCPAEIISGSRCTVRLQPPPGGEWVLQVLSLVERWLESIPLPCTKVFYGDRSYLIRLPNGVGCPQSRELITTSEPSTLH